MERKNFKKLTDDERREIRQAIFRQLNLEEPGKVRRVMSWTRIVAIGVAASLVAVVSLLVLIPAKQQAGERLLVAQTSATEIRQVVLADSSVVILNPSSTLYSVPGYSSGKREVFLEGNGFFKVKKTNARRSFVVHAGGQSVTVLGTQFNVHSRNGGLQVALTSGSVKVSADDQDISPAVLKPGEKLRYQSNGGEYQKSAVDPLLYSPWIDGTWEFRNTPLSEIALIVGEYYSMSVQFNNPETKDLRMTAEFPVTSLEVLLKVIAETLPVTITKQQNQLIIQ